MSKDYLMPSYNRAPLSFTHGDGIYLYGDDGRQYFDFTTGIGVNSLGHGHPHVSAALTEQAKKLWHVSNQYRIPQQERLAERLCEATFADRVFFSNTGAEAVECALKLTRRYFDVTVKPERWRTIVFDGAFHGRTLATIAAGGGEKYMDGFAPHIDGFDRAIFGDLASVRKLIRDDTAAILLEPVQGEGGVRAASDDFLQGLRKLADEFGLLLILDEVQSGNGRTGQLYCYQWANIQPDILATAKGLGAGFPVAACLATERVSLGFVAGSHGTTFGGNPLAMAVGNAVLDVLLAPDFLPSVQSVSEYLRKCLVGLAHKYPTVLGPALRGRGMMIGVPAIVPNTLVAEALRHHNVLVVTARDNMVRLLPPLILSMAQVDEATIAMDAGCASLLS
ncbi:aspartate aminotransferase family protein [Glaciimonas sp. PCH181]|uniref:aspartate aminotransferase family protein n=1 Tax=Glaciimonas sp. PCH181 TaxID=2133943 RepID=UPI000D3AC90A|nr:aspartate aminotransferase family protein [Glaciimonas sp. PCH181]PUA16926.1 acetylornithine transaminase [Glaciimonas sp. PCH181]